jgi:hypothetical protein
VNPTKSPFHRIQRALSGMERGDADTFEFTVGILPLAMVMVLIAGVAILRPAQLPAWIAARECARNMTTTLDSVIAETQGELAGLKSLKGMPLAGASIGPDNVVGVYNLEGGNPRNGTVRCTVSYVVPLSNIPMIGTLFGDVPMNASVRMKIDPLKSSWGQQLAP